MIVAIIPAKRESRRLENKNLLEINEKSLIAHAVDYGRASEKVDEIYVSTDCDEIAAHAKELGVRVILREDNLGGETPLFDVYANALNRIDNPAISHIVGIQPDHPDRKSNLDEAIEYALKIEAT